MWGRGQRNFFFKQYFPSGSLVSNAEKEERGVILVHGPNLSGQVCIGRHSTSRGVHWAYGWDKGKAAWWPGTETKSPRPLAVKEPLLTVYAWRIAGTFIIWEICCLPKSFRGIPLFLMLEWVPWRDSPIVIASFIRSCGLLGVAINVEG